MHNTTITDSCRGLIIVIICVVLEIHRNKSNTGLIKNKHSMVKNSLSTYKLMIEQLRDDFKSY